MPMPTVYRGPATNWGVPTTIADFQEYDAEMLIIDGVYFDKQKVKLPPDVTETFFIERYKNLIEIEIDGEDCYPPAFGNTKFKFSGRGYKDWTVKGSPYIFFIAILPQRLPGNVSQNTLSLIAWDWQWSVQGSVNGEVLNWMKSPPHIIAQTKHSQLKWGSLALTAFLRLLAVHSQGKRIPIIAFSPFQDIQIGSALNLSPSWSVTIRLYGALKVYSAVWDEAVRNLPYKQGWTNPVAVAVLDNNGELEYVTSQLPARKQRVLRRVFAFNEPTYITSTNLTQLRGVVRLSWTQTEGSMTSYSEVKLGEFIQVSIGSDNFFGIVTSVEKTQSGEDNRIVYHVRWRHPILDDTKTSPVKVKINLLPLSLIVRVFKALCHYPYPVYLPSSVDTDKIIVYDAKEEERSFSTFAEFCEFITELLSSMTNIAHFWRINSDKSISIVSAQDQVNTFILPDNNFPTIEVNYIKDISQPNAVFMRGNVRFIQQSINEEGLRIGVGGRLITSKVRIKLLGYLPAKVGDKIIANYAVTGTGWQGWVTEVSWDADASGEIITQLEVTRYA